MLDYYKEYTLSLRMVYITEEMMMRRSISEELIQLNLLRI